MVADERQGNLHRYAFDQQGRVAGTLQQDLVTEYDYEGAKLLAVHQYPEQAPEQRRSRQFGYNDSGLLTTYTNAVGDTHRYDYAQLARPIAYRRPDGHSVGYDYDLEERLTRVTRADGNQWQLGWNARGKVDRCQAPDGRDIRFHYNAAGEVIRREHPDVWVQTVERDEGGRVTTQTSQGRDRAPVTRHYQYDKYGRRTHASCADRRVRWSWNTKGQVTEHHQDQHTTSYSYTTGGHLETITLPDGTEVRYRYDKHGQWTHLDINGQPSIRRTLDNQGRETERQAGNNKQTQIHDRYGCLIKRRWQGQTPATRRYRWDAESRVEAVIDSQSGETYYERDPQGQLIKENNTTYQYDLGGNRIPEGGKVENDRLIETNNDKREYDTLGAEIRVIGKTTEARKFDAEGQLIEVKKPGVHVTYGYDALGRRAWRKSEAGTNIYVWHNDVLMGEQNLEGQWQWYIRDPESDAPLLTIANGDRFYYELDHRMMPLRLWAEDGNLVWQGNANAWGDCRPETPAEPIHQPLRLPGQFEDELTGIVQNRFRDYSPDSGRYLSPDPLGLQGGLSSYRYTKNPIDYVDPLGLNSCETNGVTPKDATLGEDGPVGDDGPAFQNIELASLAALARGPAPTPMSPTPFAPPSGVGLTGTAANGSVYQTTASRAGTLSVTTAGALTTAAGVGQLAAGPGAGLQFRDARIEQVTAPDGAVLEAWTVKPLTNVQKSGMVFDHMHQSYGAAYAAEVSSLECTDALPPSAREYFEAQASISTGSLTNPLERLQEQSYNDYLANGGTLSKQEWLNAGGNSVLGGVTSGADFSNIGRKISNKQLRHIKDRPEWLARGQGGYLKTMDDAQEVLSALHSGDVEHLGDNAQGFPVVRYDQVTGYNNNVGAGFVDQPTNVFIVKGTSKPSIVPTNPNWSSR